MDVPVFVEGLSKVYHADREDLAVRAVDRISFAVRRGESVAIIGPSGCGKSSLLNILGCLDRPTEGTYRLGGRDVAELDDDELAALRNRHIGFVFQSFNLLPRMTAVENVELPLLYGAVKDSRTLAQAALARVGLAAREKHLPSELSGGQRQRVAIARALSMDPMVILADEPVSMLDVSIRMGVLNLMERLKEERGISYLYITHDIASARYVADRTMVMYAGHIVEGAPSEELMQQPAHPYTKLLLSAVPDPSGSIRSELPARSGAPKLINPPPGCPFADRCPSVMNTCREQMPAATDVGSGHWVRCHLYPPGSIVPSAHHERKVPAPIAAVPA